MTRMRLTVMFEAGASGSLGERGTGAALEDMVLANAYRLTTPRCGSKV